MRAILFTLLLLLPAGVIAGETADSLFHEGGLAFREGRYEDAAARYEEILKTGVESGALYYNLGTVYFKLEDLGRSVGNFHRALRFIPRDEDLRINLSLAEERTLDRAIVEGGFPIFRLVMETAARGTWPEWLVLLEIVYAGSLILFALFLFRPPVRERVRTPLALLTALFVIIGIFFAGALYDQKIVDRAVVLPDEISVRSGPGDRFTEEFLLHEGTLLTLHREVDEWVFVSASPSLKGWILSRAIEKI